jgi:hypothetical protein
MNEFKCGANVLVTPKDGNPPFYATIEDCFDDCGEPDKWLVQDGDDDLHEVTTAEMTLSPVPDGVTKEIVTIDV